MFGSWGRECHVCHGRYLGGATCSDPACRRNGARRRDLEAQELQDHLETVRADGPGEPAPEEEPTAPTRDNEMANDLAEIRRLAAALRAALSGFVRRYGLRAAEDTRLQDHLYHVLRMLGMRARRR